MCGELELVELLRVYLLSEDVLGELVRRVLLAVLVLLQHKHTLSMGHSQDSYKGTFHDYPGLSTHIFWFCEYDW